MYERKLNIASELKEQRAKLKEKLEQGEKEEMLWRRGGQS